MEPNLEEMVEWRDGERAEGICLQFNSLRLFAQARPSGREIQQQLHDGLFPAAIQPHEISREVHLGAIPEIGENFLGGRFAR